MSKVGFAVLAGFAVSIAMGAGPARAVDYPICIKYGGPDNYTECMYTTMEQCRMTASGRSAECMYNPFLPKPQPAPAPTVAAPKR